jgi:LPS sulfotransferase NodH
MQHLFLCTEPRSGSNLLLQLLQNVPPSHRFASLNESLHNFQNLAGMSFLKELLGEDWERFCMFNPEGEVNRQFDLNLYRTVLPAFFTQRQCQRPVAVKWFSSPLRQLFSYLKTPIHNSFPTPETQQELNDLFGPITYVFLGRQDLWRQALSLHFAQHTGQWVSTRPAAFEINEHTVPFDFPQIQAHYQDFKERFDWWQTFFSQIAIQPVFSTTYEALAEDYPTVLNALGEALSMEIAIPPPSSLRLEKQDHPLKEDYYQRVMAILAS